MPKPKFVGISQTSIVATTLQDGVTAGATASTTAMIIGRTLDDAIENVTQLSQTLAQKLVNDNLPYPIGPSGLLGPRGISGPTGALPPGSIVTTYIFTTQVITYPKK